MRGAPVNSTREIVGFGVDGAGCGDGEVRQGGNDVVLDYGCNSGQVWAVVRDGLIQDAGVNPLDAVR